MVTEAKRAPRVVREQTNFATAAAGLAMHLPPQEALLAYKVDGIAPFEGSTVDAAFEILAQARAILELLGDAIEQGEHSGPVGRSALRGVSSLVSLSMFILEPSL